MLPTGDAEEFLARNINIDLTVKKSRKQTALYGWGTVYSLGGYMDPETCTLTIRHAEGYQNWSGPYGTIRAMPRIRCLSHELIYTNHRLVPGLPAAFRCSAFAIDPTELGQTAYFEPGSHAVTFAAVGSGGAYEGIPHGQRYKIFHGGLTGRGTFAKNGANMALTRNRTLYKPGDWLEFEYNRNLGKWVDVAGYTSEILQGRIPYDPPALSPENRSSIVTTTVTGATPGDRVEVSFSLHLAGARAPCVG